MSQFWRNIDLKAFTDGFYRALCSAELKPILETLEYVKHETGVWLEITTLLIPGHNDSPSEIAALSEWMVNRLGPDVPLHFSAFHPDWRMRDVAGTPAATLALARRIAKSAGLTYMTRRGRAPIVTPAAQASLAGTGTRSPPGHSMKAVAAGAAGHGAQAFSNKNPMRGGRRMPIALGGG